MITDNKEVKQKTLDEPAAQAWFAHHGGVELPFIQCGDEVTTYAGDADIVLSLALPGTQPDVVDDLLCCCIEPGWINATIMSILKHGYPVQIIVI